MKQTKVNCTNCGTKAARNFVTSIINGVTTQLNLCDDCFTTYEAASGFEHPKLDGAKCDYCGRPATGAGMNTPWKLAATGQRFHFSCLPCTNIKLEEMNRYFGERNADEMAQLDSEGMIEFVRELDARIRRRLQGANE